MKETSSKQCMSTPKKLIILFAAIIAIFAVINAVWDFGYKATYDELASKMDVEENTIGQENSVSYYRIVGDQKCILNMPSYLGAGGHLCVSNKDGYIPQFDNDGNIIADNGVLISLYVWPQFFGGYQLGVDLYSEKDEMMMQIYINSDLSLTNTEDLDPWAIDECEKLVTQYADEIKQLIVIAEDTWNIDLQ